MGLALSIGRGTKSVLVIHGSYTWFGRFRDALAAAAGIELRKMQGYGGRRAWSSIDDALVPLLDHSDCEGEIAWQKCARLAARVASLAPALEPDLARDADSIAKGLQRCAEERKPLTFH